MNTASRFLLGITVLLLAGCPMQAPPGLPDTYTIQSGTGQESVLARGVAVPECANRELIIRSAADPSSFPSVSPIFAKNSTARPARGAIVVRVQFDAAGNPVSATDNYYTERLAIDLGDPVWLDGQRHATGTPFLSYAAVPLAARQGDDIAVAVVVVIEGPTGPLAIGAIWSYGAFTSESSLEGQLGYELEVLDSTLIPNAVGDADQYSFTGNLVAE